MKRPITCTMGHPLDENGYHLIPGSDKHHGRIMVPLDEYEPPSIEPQRVVHTVNVVHSHKPRPRPNRIQYRFTNPEGFDYRTNSTDVYGQAVMPISVPVVWITGRLEDIALPNVTISAEFWYPEEQ